MTNDKDVTAREEKPLVETSRGRASHMCSIEELGQAVARAMGRYRGTEPLLEAVERLANDFHEMRSTAGHLLAVCQLALAAFEGNHAIDWGLLSRAIARAVAQGIEAPWGSSTEGEKAQSAK